jgi:type I restriction enzyme S subunit
MLMSKIEELISELCPLGVNLKAIDDCVYSIRSGLNPRDNFRLDVPGANNFYVTVKEITSGKIVFSDKTSRIDDEAIDIIQKRSRLEKNDVLLSGIGTIGKAAIVDIDTSNWNVSESVLLLKPRLEIINPRYLYYLLESSVIKNELIKQSVGSTLKGIRMTSLRNALIPVPPLEVQNEIVRILDNFSALEAELEAELEARTKQYEYYRDMLLDFSSGSVGVPKIDKMLAEMCPNGVINKKLEDIGTDFFRGFGIKRNELTASGSPCVRYGDIYTKYNVWFSKSELLTNPVSIKSKKYAETGDILFAITGEKVDEIGKSVAYVGKEKLIVGGDIAVMKHTQNPKYIAYSLETNSLRMQKSKGKVKSKVVHMSVGDIKKLSVFVPPLEVQNEIVEILDNLSTYVSSLSEGLPAEIKARRQQYEYYRNKLLTF